MCDQNVGVAKRLDIEKISKDVADLMKGLDNEVKLEVKKVKKIQDNLGKLVAGKRSK